jgi:hypothetical protein
MWGSGNAAHSEVVTPSVTTKYSVTGTGNNGCTTVKEVLVTTYLSSLSVIPLSPTICAGESITFSVSGANGYTWNPTQTVGQFFTTDKPWSYLSVSGTDENNCVSSVKFSLTVDQCTGITPTEPVLHPVTIFPNPTDGNFTIKMQMEGGKLITIINNMGEEVTSRRSNTLLEVFDFAEYPAGIYSLKVQQGTQIYVRKIILE